MRNQAFQQYFTKRRLYEHFLIAKEPLMLETASKSNKIFDVFPQTPWRAVSMKKIIRVSNRTTQPHLQETRNANKQ